MTHEVASNITAGSFSLYLITFLPAFQQKGLKMSSLTDRFLLHKYVACVLLFLIYNNLYLITPPFDM